MSLTLECPTAFFASDFVPSICLFSGSTGVVKPVAVRLEYIHQKQHSSFKRSSTSENWQEVVNVPANAREHSAWSLWQALGPITTLLILFFFALFCFQLAGPRDANFMPQSRNWLAIVSSGTLCFAAILLRLAGNSKVKHHLLRFEPLTPRGTVRIHFPPRLQSVHAAYAEALKTWQAAGCPQASPQDHDDGWEDRPQPGWDQADGHVDGKPSKPAGGA